MKNKLRRQPLLIFTVLGLTALITFLFIFFNRKVATEGIDEVETLVKLEKVEKGSDRIIVTAFGTVQPEQDVKLKPEVSGRVVAQSKNLVIGGLLRKGELVVKIDPRDFKIAVEKEQAAYDKAVAELKIEQGRQLVAAREWELLNPSVQASKLSKELALRQPQLRQKQADVDAAKSTLEKAQIDLERTEIRAPFDSVVIDEAVEVGDLLTPQTEIADIVGTKVFRVRVSVPVSQLRWIQIPGATAAVIQDVGSGQKLIRIGKVSRLLSDVDPAGRMARVLVEIEDPLGLQNEKKSQHPLLIGSYVRVDIEGPTLKNIFKVPREAIRQNKYVWVKNSEDKLEIRPVHIVFRGEESVLINEGLNEGDEVVVSSVSVAIPGMKLKGLDEQ